jgi:hypothetical protein
MNCFLVDCLRVSRLVLSVESEGDDPRRDFREGTEEVRTIAANDGASSPGALTFDTQHSFKIRGSRGFLIVPARFIDIQILHMLHTYSITEMGENDIHDESSD